MKPARFILILGVLLFAMSTPVFAATYYVAPVTLGGNNSNSCSAAQSIATPKLTINAGLACMVGGDTLNVRAGTYVESVSNTGLEIPSGTGFPTGATVIQAYPGDATKPVMMGNVWTSTRNNYIWDGVGINGALITPAPSADGQLEKYGGFYINGGNHIIIRNMENSNCQKICFFLYDGNAPDSDITIINNKVHDAGKGGWVSGSEPANHGFYINALNTNFSNIIIDGNEVYNNKGPGPNSWGIQVYGDTHTRGVIVRNNYVHDNNQGIVVGSGPNHQVYNNVLYNNDLAVNPTTLSCTSCSFGEAAINVAFGTVDNVQVYNNTIVKNAGNSAYGISVGTFGTVTNTKIKNNILWQNGNDAINVAGGASGTVASTNLMGSDPFFVNQAIQDFHIQSTSNAKGAGENLTSLALFTTDKDGLARVSTGAWDDGAYIAPNSIIPPVTPPNIPPGSSTAIPNVTIHYRKGTIAGTCKVTASVGTSLTEITIADNVGAGC